MIRRRVGAQQIVEAPDVIGRGLVSGAGGGGRVAGEAVGLPGKRAVKRVRDQPVGQPCRSVRGVDTVFFNAAERRLEAG